jgi:hypothetical protein
MMDTEKKQLWLQIRASEDILARLDRVRALELPPMTRSDYIRKMILEADRKADRGRK